MLFLFCFVFLLVFFKGGEVDVGLRYIIDQRSDTKKVGAEKDEKKSAL